MALPAPRRRSADSRGGAGSRRIVGQPQGSAVDMAAEMTTLTRNQILMQSGTAMLAQANSQPQSVLSLFR